MKTIAFLLTIGLVSAHISLPRQAGANASEVARTNFNSSRAGTEGFSVHSLNLTDPNLESLEVGGVSLGNIDLENQDVVAEAILAMLGALCLTDALSLDNILGFGFSNDVDLFFQLAQLLQLEQLGFMDLGSIHSLFNKALVVGGFDAGVFKREVSEAKKTMRRTQLRRGWKKVRRRCATETDPKSSEGEAAFTIATAPNSFVAPMTPVVEEARFTIATADPNGVASSTASDAEEARFTIATADPSSFDISTIASATAIAPAVPVASDVSTSVAATSPVASTATSSTIAAALVASEVTASLEVAAPIVANVSPVSSVATVSAPAAAPTPVAAVEETDDYRI